MGNKCIDYGSELIVNEIDKNVEFKVEHVKIE